VEYYSTHRTVATGLSADEVAQDWRRAKKKPRRMAGADLEKGDASLAAIADDACAVRPNDHSTAAAPRLDDAWPYDAHAAWSDHYRRRRHDRATARRSAPVQAICGADAGRTRNVTAAAGAAASAHRGFGRAADPEANREGGKSQKHSSAHVVSPLGRARAHARVIPGDIIARGSIARDIGRSPH
jgi:hypothetical protein